MTEKQSTENSLKPKVLVIDDEKVIREGCHEVLTQEGYKVVRAERGEQGLKMIEREHFDVILLDLMMPGLSGFDVLSHVKALHPDTSVIVITGYATIENSIEAMKNGAFDFIPKPFSPDQLRVVVSKAIEHTSALKDIANEKSRMRVLIDLLDNGVMVSNAENNLVLANPAFMKIMGYHGDDIIGLPFTVLVKNEQLIDMIENALSMSEDALTEVTQELDIGRDGGDETMTYVARCRPFRDRIGRNLGTITVLSDITYLKEINQLKSDFVSMVAHEIKNPMSSVLAQIQVIQDELAGDITQKQGEILGRVSERIKGLVTLSSELLSLAKKEAGLATLERIKCNMAEILKEQVDFHYQKARAKGVRLELDSLPDLPPLLANKQNMEEVLSNLITNAINYTLEKGKITVSARPEKHYLCIRVTDTGLGISEEDLGRVFDRFYRVKNKKTRYIIGTGLGLPIVKSIVEAHNGMIRVESKPDHGSTFYVNIPFITS
ncbi:MAG: response regulator [Deltaproteobacteria bacterium]|nr:response regulator [Deltaproteobacteria bacterium]